jgi:hypothetical protein
MGALVAWEPAQALFSRVAQKEREQVRSLGGESVNGERDERDRVAARSSLLWVHGSRNTENGLDS